MSKPDPAGGSLESILASIRKSLSEQSTDMLSEASVRLADQDKDARPVRKHGLTQRLAGTTAEASSVPAEQPGDDLSDLLEGPAGSAGGAFEAAPGPATAPETASAETDPLWFLTRREEAVREAERSPQEAAAQPNTGAKEASAAEPKLTRPEVLRASMPPFFGSSAEVAKPASAPVAPAAQAANSPPAARPPSPAPSAMQPGADAAIAREVSLVAAAAEAAAARPVQPQPQPALNGKGPAAASPPAAAAAPPPAHTPHNQALEAMVLDLLKPMLRQWLDQNMSRLVAEALSEEVQRTRTPEGGAKKT
ncbi:MAG: DUF2497 domain-containing protein [Hyphomonadaceae bacterium]|nr:DUF2497 domain-containing protein [Hyphomonadaceae bacterium]